MNTDVQRRLIHVAAGREPADTVIKNCCVADVYGAQVIKGQDIAIVDGYIAGIGHYEGRVTVDGEGLYALPGLIEGHMHIESSYVTPEEIGRLLVPFGTTTIIADPHEIVNVAGIAGLNYMLEAAAQTKLDIKYMMPSCVPATPWENSGAKIEAEDMRESIEGHRVWGLGEFMDYPGVVGADDEVLQKLCLARENGMLVDGHSPGLSGRALSAYACGGIHTEHECQTAEDALARVSRGMYVMLREGSACHDLKNLLPAVTKDNSRRFIFCSDDRQPKTIFEHGHLNHHLRLCVRAGMDPMTAIRMATLNAAECFRLYDRGAIAPGLRADIVLMEDLTQFRARKVWIKGELVADNGRCLFPVKRCDMSKVVGRFKVRGFSEDSLRLKLRDSRVHVMALVPGGVVTKKSVETVDVSEDGDFIFNPGKDIVKVAVIERHHGTGKSAVGLLKGYGMTAGAIALSIAHDSHNIIVAGTNNGDMAVAVDALIGQNGGIVLVKDGRVINAMPFVVGGIMTDQSGEWVSEHLSSVHEDACGILGISREVDPIMTLCFMSLSVIPELKLTALGLFDVAAFDFLPLEVPDA